MKLAKAKKLVVKVGSSILIEETGVVNKSWLTAFAKDIAALIKEGVKIIIVTSGAVGLGKNKLDISDKPLKLEEKQAAAACGQIMLVHAWHEALQKHNINTAQILLTIDDSENRRRYINTRNTLETLLENNIIPVINENDTVATSELRFGDNDRLAARVAQMVSADTLVLLSDIDGLYSTNPKHDKNAKFISEVKDITPEIEAMAGGTTGVGSGGMVTKIEAAKIALAAGCNMAIVLGKTLNPLKKFAETNCGSWFLAEVNPRNARKNWILGAIAPTGSITIDDGAKEALLKGKSLLPAGVKAVEGNFDRGDAVIVKDSSGKKIAKGLVSYSSEDANKIIGQKSGNIEQILGFIGRNSLIHRDDLVLK